MSAYPPASDQIAASHHSSQRVGKLHLVADWTTERWHLGAAVGVNSIVGLRPALVASFKSSGHPKGLGRFKVRRAAGDSDILQAPVVESFQFATRPNAALPVRELPLDIAPAQAAVGLNCQVPQVPVDRVHATLHPGRCLLTTAGPSRM